MSKIPAKRTIKQIENARIAQARAAAKKEAEDKRALEKAQAQRLAQIVNLHIGGYSLTDIGNAIGATPEEVDRMLAQDTARYVRSQPALRTYVRNWISEKYTKLIEADWDEATDKLHPGKLENQDRVDKFLRTMARLHGAEAPVQKEITIEAAPEAVEKLVAALSAAQGTGYDDTIFDVVDAEIVSDAVHQSEEFLETASRDVEDTQEGETDEF